MLRGKGCHVQTNSVSSEQSELNREDIQAGALMADPLQIIPQFLLHFFIRPLSLILSQLGAF